MSMTLASAVSTRVKALIARHHDGNRFAAARSLGVQPEQLSGLLSGDWRRFSLDALAALVHGYDVNVVWLLAPAGGDADVSARRARRTRAGEPPAAGGRASDVPSLAGMARARGDEALRA